MIYSGRNIFSTCYIKMYELQNGDKMWPGVEHSHDYVQIWYVREGECEHIVQNKKYVLKKNEFFLIPPFIEHKVGFKNQYCKIIACDFPLQILTEDNMFFCQMCEVENQDVIKKSFLEEVKKVRPKCAVGAKWGPIIENSLKKMLMIYTERSRFYSIELKASLIYLMLEIFRIEKMEASDKKKKNKEYFDDINKIKLYISGNILKKIYIKELAARAKMSVSSFCSYFKKYTGQTVVDFINDLRIEQAKGLLMETNMSVFEICINSGYNDLAYFTRAFKKHTGCTPSQFRKSIIK